MLTASGGQAFIVRLLPDGTIDGAPSGLGCSLAHFPTVAASPLHAPDSDIFAGCVVPAGGGCGGTANSSVVSHIGAQLNASGQLDVLETRCFTSPTAGAQINLRALAVDGAGNLILTMVALGPVQSYAFGSAGTGFVTPIPAADPFNLVTFKLTSLSGDYPWAAVFGESTGGFSGAGVAIDGMGDVAVALNPTGVVSMGAVSLIPGRASVVELAP
jgi:hypothetical protein